MPSAPFTSQKSLLVAAATLLVISQLPAHWATVVGGPAKAVVDTAVAPLRAPVYAAALRFKEPPVLPPTQGGPQTVEEYDLALRLALTRVERLEQQVHELRNNLAVVSAVRELTEVPTTPLLCTVTGFTHTGVKPLLTLGRGSQSGIEAGMSVVWKTAVVGRVLAPVGPTSCQVELITAHDAGLKVNVKSPPFADEIARHEPYTLRVRPGPDRLHFVSDVELDLPVRVGDIVHLADELHYPDARGLVLGQVSGIGEYVPHPMLRKQLTIRPQVDLRYLPEVAVLLPARE